MRLQVSDRISVSIDQCFSTFFPPGRTMVQVQVSRAARMSFTYYIINTNNQIYNIIYSLNIMISFI